MERGTCADCIHWKYIGNDGSERWGECNYWKAVGGKIDVLAGSYPEPEMQTESTFDCAGWVNREQPRIQWEGTEDE